MNIKGKIFPAIALVILFSPPSIAGQEVLNGSYNCVGFVDSFEQTGIISLSVELSATSGITSGLHSTGQRLSGQPADLDTLGQACNEHITEVLPLIPLICAVGPVGPGDENEPGFQVGIAFEFSCQADRDNIMNAISLLSRIPLAVGRR